MVLISIAGLFILPLLQIIPFFVTYKTAAQYILIAVLTLGVFTEGVMSSNVVWEAKISRQKLKDAKTETKAAEKTIEIVTEYVEKIKIVKEKQDALIIKVPVYITEKNDNECAIPNSAVQLFDYSATNTIPNDTDPIQPGSSDVKLSEMQDTIIKNNKLYYQLKTTYEGLLEWNKEQKKISDGNQ